MSMSVVSPVFVGRQEEFAALAALLSRVQHGEPAFAVIGGEAGVGKTRLTGELAAGSGTGRLHRPAGPLRRARGRRAAPRAAGRRARALSRTDARLTSWPRCSARPGRAWPGCCPSSRPEGPLPVPADGIQTSQLLEFVLGLLGRLSVARPVLLVLEDLHWADQSTLELVAFLIRALRGLRSCWSPRTVPTSCTAVTRSARCSPAGSGCAPFNRLDLVRFQRDEVAAQLGAILATAPGPGLVDLVFDRSGGNAYLVEELAGVVRRGGDPADLPPSLVDVLLSGVDALSEPAQRLLRTAAVAGKRVPGPAAGRGGRAWPSRSSSPPCGRRWKATCSWWTRAGPGTSSGTRSPGMRSMRTCCPASGCGCTPRTARP